MMLWCGTDIVQSSVRNVKCACVLLLHGGFLVAFSPCVAVRVERAAQVCEGLVLFVFHSLR